MAVGNAMRGVSGELVCEYLRKYPNWPSRSIGTKLYEDNPEVFSCAESARKRVCYYRGACGKLDLAKLTDRTFVRSLKTTLEGYVPLPEALPDGDEWSVRRINFSRAGIFSDVHIPYHDKAALETCLNYLKKFNPDVLVLDGDIADFYSVSFWDRDPRAFPLSEEILRVRLFLEHLRNRFRKTRIIYKEGNHEERLWRYAWRRCPELCDLTTGDGAEKLMSLGVVLDLKHYGVELVDNKQPILLGSHLHVLHGHEFRTPFVNPVNPARGLYLRANCNAICGDLHQKSEHSQGGLDRLISCWSMGCLCNLRPRYMPINKWCHGFATVEQSGKEWSVDNKKIIAGKVV